MQTQGQIIAQCCISRHTHRIHLFIRLRRAIDPLTLTSITTTSYANLHELTLNYLTQEIVSSEKERERDERMQLELQDVSQIHPMNISPCSLFTLPLTFRDQETYCHLTATRACWDPWWANNTYDADIQRLLLDHSVALTCRRSYFCETIYCPAFQDQLTEVLYWISDGRGQHSAFRRCLPRLIFPLRKSGKNDATFDVWC